MGRRTETCGGLFHILGIEGVSFSEKCSARNTVNPSVNGLIFLCEKFLVLFLSGAHFLVQLSKVDKRAVKSR